MRVAFVHDWLVTYRGGEKVLDALLQLYPEAPVYTLFYRPETMPSSITSRKVVTPALLRPFTGLRKALLPILPMAIEHLDLLDFDLIISTSSCVAKGCIPGPGAKHLSYIHSPMRYIWDQQEHYVGQWLHRPLSGSMIRSATKRLRQWDVASNGRVDHFVANSRFVAQRVKALYHRDATVVHPPVELGRFSPPTARSSKGAPYFLAAGAWVPYKRFDLALDACRLTGKRLIVAGSGPLAATFRDAASKSPLIEIRESPSDKEWVALMQGAEALLFPGTEDFGITAIEALACGTPVIAHRSGGALDFVTSGKNGLFFDDPRTESLLEVMKSFRREHFDPQAVAATAAAYGTPAFLAAMKQEIVNVLI